ncbi:endonuclease III [Ferroacidibacillus organovorans]|uniref:Endonuclease III n=1 Tax=Ferroacidibacillus organovorans TaxID=1765683 RepID=A0A1V4EQY6_9BACL|nr:endonuclease III [Ferroacidibacillus organovorans]OPG15260.1 endonuclease III [Ferroacidibacillus organovorans]
MANTLPRVPVGTILRTLEDLYPDAHCELDHRNPYELLIATILSAQCTDKRVNMITPELFEHYPTPGAMAKASLEDVERLIAQCGLYKMKAKNIVETSRRISDEHGGEVPNTMETLVALPGVGRKTANVVLSNAFGVPAIAVDTHVQRVSNRLGLADSDDVLETEQQLMRRIPKAQWTQAHHWLIFHGRRVCNARQPQCSRCELAVSCRTFRESAKRQKRKRAREQSTVRDSGKGLGDDLG